MSTGCGKTLMYSIAAISKVDPEKNEPQVLCVCITYEAALVAFGILTQLAMFTPVNVGLASQEIGFASRSMQYAYIYYIYWLLK